MYRTLDQAFHAALLLTASVEAAETAVLDGITALGPDQVPGHGFLLQTMKSASRQRADSPDQFDDALSMVPLELRRVLLLHPYLRRCFVLRVLLGITPENCSEILHLAAGEVEDAACMAMQELPFVDRYVPARRSVKSRPPRVLANILCC